MRRSHKLMVAAAAVAMPLSFMAAVAAPSLASAAAPPQLPITCAVHGTVSYNPPLTQAGVTSLNQDETTTITGMSGTGCLSSNSGDQGTTTGSVPTVTLSTAGVKTKVGKTTEYITGQCSAFASAATLKALKGLTFNITWAGQGIGDSGSSTLTTKGGLVEANGSTGEAGFYVSGGTTGDYTYGKSFGVVYLNNTGDIAQCGANIGGPWSISSSTIDPAVSTLTI